MTLKRWTALLLAGSLAVLPACTRRLSAPPAAPVKIQFWHAMPQEGTPGRLVKELVQQFNSQQSEVVVEAVYQGSFADLEARLASGAPPEVIQITDDLLTAKTEALQPLDDLIAPEEQADYPYPLLQAGRRDGKLYALPFTRAATVLIYDTSRIPTPPETWEEFRETARRLTSSESFGTVLMPDVYTFGQYLIQAGGSWLQDGAPAFDSAAGVQALEFMAGMIREGSAHALGRGEYASDFFTRGLTPMVAVSSASIPFIKPASPVPWGVAQVPAGPRNALVPLTGASLAVTAGLPPEKARAAARFITWMTGTEATLRLVTAGTGYLPVRTSAVADPRWQTYVAQHPEMAVLAKLQHDVVSLPVHPRWAELQREVSAAVDAAASGRSTARQALTQAAKRSKEILAQR